MADDDIAQLRERLARLEAIEGIRALKARYLNACDRKRPDEVRACFADGAVHIDTGYRGVFEDADTFVAMYRDAACHDDVFDKHQGGNAEIITIDADHATGRWCLDYRNVNSRTHTLTLMSTLYHDAYERIAGRWFIRASRCEFRTVFHARFEEGALRPLLAGQSLAEPAFSVGASAPAF